MAAKKKTPERLMLENVHLIFKNFRGEASQYNAAGNRNFCVVIDDAEEAARLSAEGWNIRQTRGDEDQPPDYILTVKLNYNGRVPPRVIKISSSDMSRQIPLTESTVEMLDYLPIESADVLINPYPYTVRGESGISAYCQTLYAVIREDALDAKWLRVAEGGLPFDADE